MINFLKKRNGQEEMIGFALIIVLVAVILVVFLGFMLHDSDRSSVENYEVQSFLGAVIQYTSDCEDYVRGPRLIRDLVFDCYSEKECVDGRKSCDVLNETISEIISHDPKWQVGEDSPVNGYRLNIFFLEEDVENQLMIISDGNFTGVKKGGTQNFAKSSGEEYIISFETYSKKLEN